MESSQLRVFLSHVADRLVAFTANDADAPSVLEATGLFQSLAYVFKHGSRRVLRACVPLVMPSVVAVGNSELPQRSMLLRRLVVKVVQRVGVSYLPPRVPDWLYRRGTWGEVGVLGGCCGR